MLGRQAPQAPGGAATAAPAQDPIPAPLTDADWRAVDMWLSRGEVGIDKLTADPDHNAS